MLRVELHRGTAAHMKAQNSSDYAIAGRELGYGRVFEVLGFGV